MLRILSQRARRRVVTAAVAATLGATLFPASADALASSTSAASTTDAACGALRICIPQTVVLDGAQLAVTRLLVRAGLPALAQPLGELTAQADSYLNQGPWSVVDKPELAPSGDTHDYLSQAPYWWPTQPKTASNPWGCPYVQRDGVTNPDINLITDHAERGKMFNAVYTLTLAWYYTDDPAYAQRAALDLRTWFIDPATRMNSSLAYPQFIPCLLSGRGIGFIFYATAST